MRALAKLLVDETVLPCQSLDILGKLSDLLSLELGQLGLLIDLLSHALSLLAQSLDLLLSFEESALVGIFFASSDAHLVLHVGEVKALFLKLLPSLDQFFGLLVEVTLHLIKIAVQHGNALLEVSDLLIFGKEFLLVSLDVVKQDSFFILTTS